MEPFKLTARFYVFFTIIALIPATWLAALIQSLIENSSLDILRFLTTTGVTEPPTAVVVILLLFWWYESFLWRIWPLNLLHDVPYIAGRYEGEVESSYKDAGGNSKFPIVLELHQSLLHTTVCLYTPRSSSFNQIAILGKNEHGNNFLAYLYKNTPKTVSDDRDMRPHDGFACLEIFPKELRLDGSYYSDPRERGTFGRLSCTRKSRVTSGHF